ncbi:DUF602-domain-containing protein [Pyrenochaeta sp. DS3sAY3a]|nr:DUF602-domain-containing protein [Pyrenochaeta sp. DS3sAY3a]
MGNDGGSIPKRNELVKEAAKALTAAQIKEAQTEQQEYGWTTDPLTRKPLARPVVSDGAGVLYNKESIIEYLLKEEGGEKAEMRKVGGVKGTVEGGFSELGTFGDRVKGLKDVVEVNFEISTAESEGNGRGERWVCPITGNALGPGTKAVYIVPCGHAFAGSVVKEVNETTCLTCSEPYAENDVIPILPTAPTDIARLNLRLKTLKEKGLTHALKKAPGSKKRKKNIDKDANSEAAENGAKTSDEDKKSSDPEKTKLDKQSKATNGASNGIKNASTASLTRKVMEEQEERNKRRKLAQNDNVNSLFSKGQSKPGLGNSADYMTRGFSIGKK